MSVRRGRLCLCAFSVCLGFLVISLTSGTQGKVERETYSNFHKLEMAWQKEKKKKHQKIAVTVFLASKIDISLAGPVCIIAIPCTAPGLILSP